MNDHCLQSAKRTLWWASLENNGIERCVLTMDAERVVAKGVLIGDLPGRRDEPYGLFYNVECDLRWVLRRVTVALPGEKALDLRSGGAGNWKNAQDEPLDELLGCVDVDISATPFSNTLPIRRLGLCAGERREIDVVYIAAPSLEVRVLRQAYTKRAAGRFRYENLSSGYTAELTVDEEGLVVDYPELFARIRGV